MNEKMPSMEMVPATKRLRLARTRFALGAAATTFAAFSFALPSRSQVAVAPFTVHVEVIRRMAAAKTSQSSDFSNVAVWLTPINDASEPMAADRTIPPKQNLRIVQRNKTFQPRVLVVPVGSVVEFPNNDPFFHNVFSLFDGKRFDLGLYEGGSSNSARFEHPGVSFVFCNIHPEMSAAIVSVDTPYYALSNRAGLISIPNVPDGRYFLHVWYERSSAEELKSLEHVVVLNASNRNAPALKIIDNGDIKLTHKNKYGTDYTPVPEASYKRP
jgi:plastocyanin